jgi:LemA protein
MKVVLLIVSIIVCCVLFIGGCAVTTRNTAVMLEENVKTAKSGIDTQLTTRYNKLLELAQVIKAYDKHESETLIKTIEARGKNATEGEVKSTMASIHAVAERYPELKAQANYGKMMDEVSLMENTISHHRHAYNETVREYSRYVRSFPACFVLGLMGYEIQKFEYYEAPVHTQDTKPLELF